jgi:alkaline phosphatase
VLPTVRSSYAPFSMRPSLRALAIACTLPGCDEPSARTEPVGGLDGGLDAALQVDSGSASDDAAARQDAQTARRLARNIIVFMGDGMGPEQLSTARFVKPTGLRIDELEGPALVRTDSRTTLAASDPEWGTPTDSAAAATAIATGVLVENGVVSESEYGAPLETLLELCKRGGKATGVVTTSYFFDASPAAFAAHRASRGDYEQIARQMLTLAQPDVIMGDGAHLFDDESDGLMEEAARSGYFVVRGAEALSAWNPREQPRLLGLFATDFVPITIASELFSMTPALERRTDSPDPTLATMTARALERLAVDPEGFFLFAEDEIFDEIGHRGPAEVGWANRAYPAQAAALDDAIGVAIDWVHAHSSFAETLIVLLADHETGGYRYDHAIGPASGEFFAFSAGGAYFVGAHTRARTAVFARGPGSASLARLDHHVDTHALLRGDLLDERASPTSGVLDAGFCCHEEH